MKKRKIQIITGSRGEWGYIRPLIELIKQERSLSYEVVVTNMHLLPEFGYSLEELEKEKIKISDRIHMAVAGFNNTTMAKSLSVFLASVVDTLHRSKPDIVLLAGDRGEQLMACIAAAYMNIPVAHIQAGELSGNIDGAVRHAITKLAHIHFAATADAYQRLIRMGEERSRCFQTGAPQLDDFLRARHQAPKNVRRLYHLKEEEKLILCLQHSVTHEAEDAYRQMRESIRAVKRTGIRCVLIWPNNDAGNLGVRDAIKDYCDASFIVERNVSREIYGGLLSTSSTIVGNSSSALIEAPSFKLPAVNIGNRQRGRERGKNVIDVPCIENEIHRGLKRALSPEFRRKMNSCKNPYGDGKASERILQILKSVRLDKQLLQKTLTY